MSMSVSMGLPGIVRSTSSSSSLQTKSPSQDQQTQSNTAPQFGLDTASAVAQAQKIVDDAMAGIMLARQNATPYVSLSSRSTVSLDRTAQTDIRTSQSLQNDLQQMREMLGALSNQGSTQTESGSAQQSVSAAQVVTSTGSAAQINTNGDSSSQTQATTTTANTNTSKLGLQAISSYSQMARLSRTSAAGGTTGVSEQTQGAQSLQQLGTTALAGANQSTQQVLSLFR